MAGRLRFNNVLVVLLALVLVSLANAAWANNEKVGAAIRAIIEEGKNPKAIADSDKLFDVYTYYQERDYKPLWVRDNGPKSKGRDFLDILRSAREDGLDPRNYLIDEIAARMEDKDAEGLATLDLLLSKAFLEYGSDLSVGRVTPDSVAKDIHLKPRRLGVLNMLDAVEQADDIPVVIDALAPQSGNYARLKEALLLYRDIAARGGWPKVPSGPVLKPGMKDPRVPALRELLIATADLSASAPDMNELYDGAVVEAVKLFQERHGLTADGVIGPGTLEQFNAPIEDRIQQLVLNMERRRWIPDDTSGFYIFVNLADQYLKVVKDDKTIHDARLVVGKPFSRTPDFTEKMTYLVFNPYWNVPTSIAVNEYLPKLKANPAALNAGGFEVEKGGQVLSPSAISWSSYGRGNFPVRLRQKPGEKNALGRLKFMFPNPYNIYIHDTPSRNLFNRDNRFFSHGCMRVENPEKLAEVLLGHDDPTWSTQKIAQRLDVDRNAIVKLKKPVPVYVNYLTAWANKDSAVNFRKDVYGRDAELLAALRKTGHVVD